mmetsp:Transcript_36838/g.105584  ORF Transcript_36838/g.105584 Transcript_36838/m.105584 type:complete len:217 (+) Transcript_36838:371-1021(+)
MCHHQSAVSLIAYHYILTLLVFSFSPHPPFPLPLLPLGHSLANEGLWVGDRPGQTAHPGASSAVVGPRTAVLGIEIHRIHGAVVFVSESHEGLVWREERLAVELTPIHRQTRTRHLYEGIDVLVHVPEAVGQHLRHEQHKVGQLFGLEQPLQLLQYAHTPLPPQGAQNEPHCLGPPGRLDGRLSVAVKRSVRIRLTEEPLCEGVVAEEWYGGVGDE